MKIVAKKLVRKDRWLWCCMKWFWKWPKAKFARNSFPALFFLLILLLALIIAIVLKNDSACLLLKVDILFYFFACLFLWITSYFDSFIYLFIFLKVSKIQKIVLEMLSFLFIFFLVVLFVVFFFGWQRENLFQFTGNIFFSFLVTMKKLNKIEKEVAKYQWNMIICEL